ncbi:acetyl-CoA carboxylase biotin carboxylase subunit [Candidatus Leptofilum sp.]|uniref:acetyl-CoA carboxylase biotin carboxylase subunit n=1 Tax=Candidatus Leptofilum sp. TaxID=3241576 RepID=UPI003B5CF115
MFRKVLIANRGEIARRLILACHELGITAVAIYSDADAEAPWVRLADERYNLPGVSATDTYLNQTAVLDIATACGAEAIHPGYGFLSENATFATACAERGIVFIGPSPEAIELMGSKAKSREIAEQAGVPIVPGVDGARMSAAELQTAVAHIEFPILIKASAGGGGKGMRVVWSADQFADAVQAARGEAQNSFGDDHVLVEKYFTQIHHVEIQVLGDQYGNVLHLFERECSIQRRHQKIIEETPAPVIQDDDLRQRMAAAAVSLAKAVNYSSAGTVEFIVDEKGGFYFLEMNTRLQVEHPITELVTGIDIAVWQIRIANDEPLPFRQEDIQQRGHAIECRVYAEDPANNFLPSIGEIARYERPSGPGIRVDDGIESGTAVSPYYDPMLAKIITWGHNREEAIGKMIRALQQTVVLGVTTNIPYLLAILQEPTFCSGHTSTSYLQEIFPDWRPDVLDEDGWLGAAVFELLRGGGKKVRTSALSNVEGTTAYDPWGETAVWRNVRR